MPHVCFCHKDIGDIDRGGVCVLFKTIMKGLVERGWEVSCLTQQEFTNGDMNVIQMPQIRNYLEYSRAVSEELSILKPDIAECSNWRVELLDFVRNRDGLKTKVIIRSDPSPQTLFGDRRFFEAEKELYYRADKVLAVSKFARKDIEINYNFANAKVIYNAVDEPTLIRFQQRDLLTSGFFYEGVKQIYPRRVNTLVQDNKFNIFWCGKTTAMKGFDYLEQIVLNAPNHFSFVINLGSSPCEINWSSQAINKATFIHELKRSDQLAIWKQCDAFLSTSRVEGFGLALLEGLLLGLPVVANINCSVYHEFMPNKKLFLIDVTDADSVLDCLHKLSGEQKTDKSPKGPDLRNLRFTKKRLINESEKVYRELLKK